MCLNCWEEYNIDPVINQRVKDVVNLIANVYNSPGGGAGGSAHIVFDDWNIDDSCIDFCLNYQLDNDELKLICDNALLEFKKLTSSERLTALAIQDKIISIQ